MRDWSSGRSQSYFFGICSDECNGWSGSNWRRSSHFACGKPGNPRKASFGIGHCFAIGWRISTIVDFNERVFDHCGQKARRVAPNERFHWNTVVPAYILFRDDDMNPDRALNQQIERYRRMTGEQRLRIALELHELSCNVAREGIRRQNPNADEAGVERLLRQRLELARQ